MSKIITANRWGKKPVNFDMRFEESFGGTFPEGKNKSVLG